MVYRSVILVSEAGLQRRLKETVLSEVGGYPGRDLLLIEEMIQRLRNAHEALDQP